MAVVRYSLLFYVREERGNMMKLFHISDLHLGKKVYEFSMLADQEHALDQICGLAETQQPDGILISGDVYDKSVPPVEAVQLFDHFLTRLQKMGIAIYLISGNHDSAIRLDFGSRILEQQNIYLCGAFDGTLHHIVQEDTYGEIHFYLLPFLKPAMLLPFLEEERHLSYEQAIQWVLSHANIDTTKRNILLAHQFVTWKGTAEESDSERKTLGGIDEIDASLFFDFDYVALGHLHSPQRIGKDTIRYGGSLLRYSFSELRQKKGVTVIELQEKGSVSIEFYPLQSLHNMREIKGPLASLLQAADAEGSSTDYVRAILTDSGVVLDPVGKLRQYYPNLMCVERTSIQNEFENKYDTNNLDTTLDGQSLFSAFFAKQQGHALTQEQNRLLTQVWQKIGGEEV